MMDLITLDFETRYDRAYSLTKMTTEAYVRDARFKAFGVGIKINDGPSMWFDDEESITLALTSCDIPNNAVLCHHAQFDGFILNHHYNLRPRAWYDTLSMARAIHGTEVGNSLKKLAEHYGIGVKGTEVQNTLGKSYLTKAESHALGEYCKNDVDLTYDLFLKLSDNFPKSEYRLIDKVIRLFTEPILRLDYALLKESLEEIQAHKLALLLEAGISKEDLMSNAKFAEILCRLHVDPPRKISKTTGRETWAFAKTDPGIQALMDHPDPTVQAIVAARLGVKSTIAETRTEAFMGIAQRGAAPVYLKYSGAAQTHRLSGGDKVNWQNLGRGSKLRDAVMAPPGFKLVVVDSSNIESRVLDYLAGEEWAMDAYRAYDRGEGPDIYCVMGEKIYGRPIDKEKDPNERFLGKVAKLGLGYGMGREKFLSTAVQFKVPDVDATIASHTVAAYRTSHEKVVALWGRFDQAIGFIASGSQTYSIDKHGILTTKKGAILLPNGLNIRYPELVHTKDGWEFKAGRETVKLYGGKGIENCVQALARVIVMEQTVALAKKWRLVHSVHDEAVFCVPESKADECLADALKAFRTAPKWASDLPLNASGDTAVRYGDAK